MSMKIRNNMSTVSSLSQFNKNNNHLVKALQKVATGQKINSAGDNASDYGISEKMRDQIRALDQDIQNVQNGSTMLKIAHGGIQEIINDLRSMKELAINAANDSNTDADRAIIQKEFDQRRAAIDDIATWTNYNTKPLLDGTYSRGLWDSIKEKFSDLFDDVNLIEPTGGGTVSDYIISRDGVYDVSSFNDATLVVESKNVKLIGTATNVSILVNTDEANLWIENLSIENTVMPYSNIKFLGANNHLTIKGNNTLNMSNEQPEVIPFEAVINMGKGLTIGGDGRLSINLVNSAAACIGTDAGEESPGNLFITGGTFNIRGDGASAGIGSSENGKLGNIGIRNANITIETDDGACIGSGGGGSCGDIYIENSILNLNNSNLGNSTVGGFTGGGGAGIGSGTTSSVGDIIIGDRNLITATSVFGAGIGSGALGSTAGDIYISGMSSITARSTGITDQKEVIGHSIGAGYESTVGNISKDDDSDSKNILTIHHGTRSNQRVNFYINDMHSSSLGIDKAEVTTMTKANTAIGIIDDAITYALREATYVGSYLQRLEYTETNVIIANENIQGAESTIRDADMAKEMTNYTKYNVLSQASQSMLAQANQNMSGVLSLLQ